MNKDYNDILKEIHKISKTVESLDNRISKELQEVKKYIKQINSKILTVLDKIQEFEIIMDAAEILEDHIQEEEDKYNTEWSPYDDDHELEDYEGYDNDIEEDES